MAKLLYMMARRRDDGERDYGNGAAAVVSAMVRESDREGLGRRGHVCELGGAVCDRTRAAAQRGEEAGGGQLRSARRC